jgi:predicted 2-oxoglutarate/Fe(II)-dependent dioxygenase YbiX
MSFLGHYKNMVDNSLCDNIINTNFKFQKSTYSTHKGLSPDKERVKMDEIWIRKNEKFYDEIKDIVSKVSDLYTAKMKRVNKRDFIVSKSTDFRLNRYDVGGYMSLHTDNIHHSHGQKFGYPQASVLLFLNDDFKGGQFVVSNIHLNISKGDALIFPSNFMFPHEVKKVTKGTRWSIISWLM